MTKSRVGFYNIGESGFIRHGAQRDGQRLSLPYLRPRVVGVRYVSDWFPHSLLHSFGKVSGCQVCSPQHDGNQNAGSPLWDSRASLFMLPERAWKTLGVSPYGSWKFGCSQMRCARYDWTLLT